MKNHNIKYVKTTLNVLNNILFLYKAKLFRYVPKFKKIGFTPE